MIGTKTLVQPRKIRLEAATACQLKCPACPTASGETGKNLGVGFLKLKDFKIIVDKNPQVAHIELSNWGEILLNKELPEILEYAYKNNVAMYSRNGNNLNTASREALEAIVKYKLRVMTCSVDGATQETYARYRVNGNLEEVLNNIRTINEFKIKYRSRFPHLRWQFIPFGHNEHEIAAARKLAKELNSDFSVKLSWADLFTDNFSPIKDAAMVRRESRLGVADRNEYRDEHHEEFNKKCCLEMWKTPQLNFDGKVLGCSVNFWGQYGNALTDGLEACLNSEKMNTARAMLMGKVPAQKDIPCTTCTIYRNMKKNSTWINDEDIRQYFVDPRWLVMLENKYFTLYVCVKKVFGILGQTRRIIKWLYRHCKNPGHIFKALKYRLFPPADVRIPQLKNKIYPLRFPFATDEQTGWMPHHIFRGRTQIIEKMTCHISTLIKGSCPHPPAHHWEEELLLVLSGEVDVILPQGLNPEENQRRRLKTGEFVYYPAHFSHTLETVSDQPAHYLMFKWRSYTINEQASIGWGQYSMNSNEKESSLTKGFNPRTVFEGATTHLKKLHCHTTLLKPGAKYDPHIDEYDVAIVVLEGEVITLNRRAKPFDVIFYPAGKPHGMRNPANTPAKYIVFEFHGIKPVSVNPFVERVLCKIAKVTTRV